MQLKEITISSVGSFGEITEALAVELSGYKVTYEWGAQHVFLFKKSFFENGWIELERYEMWNENYDVRTFNTARDFFNFARSILMSTTKKWLPTKSGGMYDNHTIKCAGCDAYTTPSRFECLACDPKVYTYPKGGRND